MTPPFYVDGQFPNGHILHAEAPGIYKALPATVEAMYAPELRANSEDFKVEIGE